MDKDVSSGYLSCSFAEEYSKGVVPTMPAHGVREGTFKQVVVLGQQTLHDLSQTYGTRVKIITTIPVVQGVLHGLYLFSLHRRGLAAARHVAWAAGESRMARQPWYVPEQRTSLI